MRLKWMSPEMLLSNSIPNWQFLCWVANLHEVVLDLPVMYLKIETRPLLLTTQVALKQCNNAIGKAATQRLAEISIPFMVGLAKEINGQDASAQAKFIRQTLSCNCGVGSLGQNQMTPINPSVTNIVLNGVGGTFIGAPTVTGTNVEDIMLYESDALVNFTCTSVASDGTNTFISI